VTFGGSSIMVWGAFSLHHSLPLYLINGNLALMRYRDEILTSFAVPLLRQMGAQAVYQDDNAQSTDVDAYLELVGVNRINWPACSPDLNPTETFGMSWTAR